MGRESVVGTQHHHYVVNFGYVKICIVTLAHLTIIFDKSFTCGWYKKKKKVLSCSTKIPHKKYAINKMVCLRTKYKTHKCDMRWDKETLKLDVVRRWTLSNLEDFWPRYFGFFTPHPHYGIYPLRYTATIIAVFFFFGMLKIHRCTVHLKGGYQISGWNAI